MRSPCPDAVIADRAYSSGMTRQMLHRRHITAAPIWGQLNSAPPYLVCSAL
jgi:hypothetical protein